MSLSTDVVSKRAADQVFHIAEQRWPNEACGLILGDVVYELPNRSPNPESEYFMAVEDWPEEVLTLLGFCDSEGTAGWFFERLRVWHTHPSGQIGPSSMDIDRKDGVDNRIRFLVFTPFVNEVREF